MKKLLVLILTLGVLNGETRELDGNDFKSWTWQESQCPSCEIEILPLNQALLDESVLAFFKALESHKSDLIELYGVSGQEYNLLAHMAVGILGQESEFFQGTTYRIKETFPWLVSFMKNVKGTWKGQAVTPNSRGPTQIKIVPQKIAEAFRVTPDDLWKPKNAALATMGFLIEALRELKNRVVVNKLEFVHTGNYVDYLPYIYFGGTKMLIAGNATPDRNLYVRSMKRYMGWVLLRERPFVGTKASH